MTAPPVVAAGAVCWRMDQGRLRVLLVRAAGRAHPSFPKGKLDAGESAPAAAVREVEEETGLSVGLAASLGTSEYTLPGGREKVVHYWAAEARDAGYDPRSYAANDEIASVEWTAVKQARAALGHAEDRAVLDRFLARAERDELRTFPVVVLRHGKAVPGGSWPGSDASRPLEPAGAEQARRAAPAIAAFAPEKLISSTAARCTATILPLAALTGLDVQATAAISQDAHDDGAADVAGVVARRLRKAVPAVLCSHGPVLPVILEELATQSGSPRGRMRRASALDVGDFAVVHLSTRGGVVAVETHSPATAN